MIKQVEPRFVSTSVSGIEPLDLSDVNVDGEMPPLFSPPPVTKQRTNSCIVRGLPFSYVKLTEPRLVSTSVSHIEPLDILDWDPDDDMDALFSPRPDTKDIAREFIVSDTPRPDTKDIAREFVVSDRRRFKQQVCMETKPEICSRTEEVKCYRNSSTSLEFDNYNWFVSTLTMKPVVRARRHVSTIYVGPKILSDSYVAAVKHRVRAPERRRWSVSEVFVEATLKLGGLETKHLGSWDATYEVDEETDIVDKHTNQVGRMRKNPRVQTRAASVN